MRITLFFISIFLFAVSCSSKKKDVFFEVKIAKTVPPVYILSSDPGFENRQDTVYYQKTMFTGFRYSLHPNKDTAFIQSYFNGVEEGEQKGWFPNGQKQESRFYINGKKEGLHQGWWPNGKRKFYFTTYNNEYNGEFFEWYQSGLLGKVFHYKAGKEEGSQRLWWDNGTVRANYVVKSGKKYGLIGNKICMNPYDSLQKK